MTTLPLLITLYAATVFAALAGYVVYLQYSSLRGDESEIRVLERLELHLAHILRLLEAPDVGALLQAPASRQRLFLDFSSYLKEDVLAVLRTRKLRPASILLLGVFFLSYYPMRLKARLSCGRNDLRFLSGLELALMRSLQEIGLG